MVGHPVWTRRGGLGYTVTRTCRICTTRFTTPCTTTIKSFPKNNKTKQNSSESKGKLDDFINRPNKENNVSKENIESEHTTSTKTNTTANTAQKKNHARSRTRAIKSQEYRPQAYKPQAFSEPLTKPQAYYARGLDFKDPAILKVEPPIPRLFLTALLLIRTFRTRARDYNPRTV